MHNCMMKREEIQEIQGLRAEMNLLKHAALKVEIIELMLQNEGNHRCSREEMRIGCSFICFINIGGMHFSHHTLWSATG